MKKKIFGLAFIAMSLVAFNGMAQTSADKENAAKCINKECVKGKKGDKQCSRAKANLFEGMNLTADQKSKLQKLDESRKAKRQEQAKARKADKQRRDSMRIAERRADKKAYLDEVKAILGNDQYIVFLENFYINGGNGAGNHKAFKKGMRADKDKMLRGDRNHKADRKDKLDRKNRADRQNRADRKDRADRN